MSSGDPEYRALFDAMDGAPPACASDDRFILDEPDVAELAPVCERCPYSTSAERTQPQHARKQACGPDADTAREERYRGDAPVSST
jgi:hypothetical protein